MKYKSCYDILKEEYSKRLRVNSSYSLRAFAKKIEVSPSKLSEIFNHKQSLSEKKAIDISKKLNFDEDKKEFFQLLAISETSRSSVKKEAALNKLEKFKRSKIKELTLDQYALISNWEHLTLYCLMQLSNFKNSISWMEEKTGLSAAKIRDSMTRLKRLGMLKYNQGRYKVIDYSPISTTTKIPSDIIKEHHSQLIEKANIALYDQPMEKREFNSLIFNIRDEDVQEIKDRISNFYKELNSIYGKENHKTEKVYCFTSQFFDLLEHQGPE